MPCPYDDGSFTTPRVDTLFGVKRFE